MVRRLTTLLLGVLLLVGAGATVATTASASPTAPILQRGSSGPGVGCVQAGLNFVGGAGLDVDDDFGGLTEQAVKNFQRFFGLAPDGKVGKKTGSLLFFLVNYKAGYPIWPVGGGCWTFIPTET
jgi:peptidoglycan hydrolase-like protein with peptidoglycan-binding domain